MLKCMCEADAIEQADNYPWSWHHPIAVEPRDGYRIWVLYPDGTQGEIDLADMLRWEVGKPLKDRKFFEGVHINKGIGCVCWGIPEGAETAVDTSPEWDYAELLGMSRAEIEAFPTEMAFNEALLKLRQEKGLA